MTAVQRRWAAGFLGVVFAYALPAPLAAQGKLDEVSKTTRDGDHDDHDHDGAGDDDGLDDFLFDDDEDWSASLIEDDFGRTFAQIVLFPFSLPREILGDHGNRGCRFARKPYDDERGFWLTPVEPPEGEAEDDSGLPESVLQLTEPEGRRASLRPRVELGSDFDDLERFGLALLFEHENRFGIDALWSRWREELPGSNTDELDLGDVNLVYRFAQGAHASARADLGLNFLDDDIDEELGFNVTYGGDILPVEPLVLSGELDWGTLGDATLLHLRGSAGVVLDHFELYAGVDYYEIDEVDLRAFSVGLRGWL